MSLQSRLLRLFVYILRNTKAEISRAITACLESKQLLLFAFEEIMKLQLGMMVDKWITRGLPPCLQQSISKHDTSGTDAEYYSDYHAALLYKANGQ